MKLGVAVPVSGSWATPENIVSVAREAEALGYHSLWTFQRLLAPLDEAGRDTLDPQYRSVDDPLAILAYLASATTTVRLGVAVVNLPFYAPIVLAKTLTTIDRLSGGRLDAGFGLGWMPEEFAATGADSARRGARTADYLDCMKAIWTDEVVEYDGPFYSVPRCRVDPKPVQRPHPPILLGGSADVALKRVGRLAGGWISASRADLSSIDTSIALVRSAAEAAGRDPAALRFICRGVVKVRRTGERGPLCGTIDQIRGDLEELAGRGVTETFLDCNFDPEIGSPDADPAVSVGRVHELLEALTPGKS